MGRVGQELQAGGRRSIYPKELLPFAMSNLIETYEAAGIFDAALALTRRYLELYPDNEDSFDKRIKIGILYNG